MTCFAEKLPRTSGMIGIFLSNFILHCCCCFCCLQRNASLLVLKKRKVVLKLGKLANLEQHTEILLKHDLRFVIKDFTFRSLLVSGSHRQLQFPTLVYVPHFLFLGTSSTKMCSKSRKPRQNLPREDFSRRPSQVSLQLCHPPSLQEQLPHSVFSFLSLNLSQNISPSIASPKFHREFCPCFQQTKWQPFGVWFSTFGNTSLLEF